MCGGLRTPFIRTQFETPVIGFSGETEKASDIMRKLYKAFVKRGYECAICRHSEYSRVEKDFVFPKNVSEVKCVSYLSRAVQADVIIATERENEAFADIHIILCGRKTARYDKENIYICDKISDRGLAYIIRYIEAFAEE